ncbi:MAG TPA: urea carboxylase-associated family protein [Stellaceae bacterium]|nr:urea carboxylase-associated family protein [Stellaceae bacterium]
MTDPALAVIPARRGKAVALARGQTIRVINTHGTQVLDTWAFNRGDLGEAMSMEHSRSFNSKIMLGVGDSYVSERRRPMLTVIEDTSPGIHDTLLCACNRYIYEEQGCRDYHRNCADNLHEALAEMGLKVPFTPGPLNLFMNIPVNPDHSISRLPPVSRAGDHVRLKAAMDLVVVFSACPQDMSPINGAQKTPRDAHYAIEG